jgi:hypothetical protein
VTGAKAIDLASAVVVALAIVAAAAAILATRRPEVGLVVVLDLLMCAGLLHLAAGPTYTRAATAAIILGIRRLITWTLVGAGRTGMAPGLSRIRGLARRLRLREFLHASYEHTRLGGGWRIPDAESRWGGKRN